MRFRIVRLAFPIKDAKEDTDTGITKMVAVMNQVDKLEITLSGMNADLFQPFALGCLKNGFAVFELA